VQEPSIVNNLGSTSCIIVVTSEDVIAFREDFSIRTKNYLNPTEGQARGPRLDGAFWRQRDDTRALALAIQLRDVDTYAPEEA
jgi:hypothetical protein